MENILHTELINNIYSFYNPYKFLYNKILLEIKSKYIYNYVMRQLLQFNIRNKKGEIVYFAKYSILESLS